MLECQEAITRQCLDYLEDYSIFSGLVTRKLSAATRMVPEDSPQGFHQSKTIIVPRREYGLAIQTFGAKYLESAVQQLVRQEDNVLVDQLCKLLVAYGAVVPPSIVGVERCLTWMEDRFCRNHTRTAGRNMIGGWNNGMAFDAKSIVSRASLPDLNYSGYILSGLQDYVLVFQCDAITITYSQLLAVGEHFYTTSGSGRSLRSCIDYAVDFNLNSALTVDFVSQITQVNCLHCCVIPVKQCI